MQYNITMKYEDTNTKTKVFTDQEIPKKPPGCQVSYLLRISYISRHVQFSEVLKVEREKKVKKQNKNKQRKYLKDGAESFFEHIKRQLR